MIDVQALHKEFGDLTAVDRLSFCVEPGDILGFLGPNGAGKSTSMKMLTGYLEPTSGTASICGADIMREPIRARKSIGYLPESSPFYGEMTVSEYLDFIGDMRLLDGARKRDAEERVRSLCFLEGVWNQPIETLSKGFRQRVGIAQALIHDPPVLIMDEPTDGLDPNQKFEVRELIREIAPTKTIVLSTHILEEVEAICTRVIIIAHGKLLIDSTPAELKSRGPLDEVFRQITLGTKKGARHGNVQAAV